MLKISIITVCYNSVTTIERTIQSVLSQTYPNIEYIIVDGGSTDGTLNSINKYKDRIHKIISEKDKGIYDAMNKGLGVATGDVIGFLNSDDFYTNNESVKSISAAFNDSGIDGCYADLQYVNKKDQIIRHWKSGNYTRLKFYFGWMPPHPTFYARKSLFDKYGHFDIAYQIAADYELILRFVMKNRIQLKYLQQCVVTMAAGGVSNKGIKNIIKANCEVSKAWEKNGIKMGFLVPFLKPIQKIPQFFI